MKRVVFSVSVTAAWILVFSGPALAHDFVLSHSSNANVTLGSPDNWTLIRSATVTIPGGDAAAHGCVATASADMFLDPSIGSIGVENQYRFVLTLNNTNPVTNLGSERMLELVNNEGVNDPDSKPVSTTQTFFSLRNNNGVNATGTHTFYFLGRKVAATVTTADVLDASLSVVCADFD